MKKKSILAIMCALIAVTCIACASPSQKSQNDDISNQNSDSVIEDAEKVISDVENELGEMGTSVKETLIKQRDEYRANALAAETPEEQEQWTNLADSIDIMLQDYEDYEKIETGS